MKLVVAALAALAIVIPTKAFSCDEHEGQAKSAIKSISVKELADAKQAGKATVYDANNAETRASMGIIPGAKLLTSAVKYEPAKELPADKSGKVVFYCYNEQCGASHMAAKKASEAGYTDVAVLPAGIKGWKDAGQPTAKPSNS